MLNTDNSNDNDKKNILNCDKKTNYLFKWLKKLKFSHYYQSFLKNGISYGLLENLDSELLKKIGVISVAERLKFEIAISVLKLQKLLIGASVNDLHDVIDICFMEEDKNESNNEEKCLTKEVLKDLKQCQNKMNDLKAIENKKTEKDRDEKCVKQIISCILQCGLIKKIDITGCFGTDSIKRRLKKRLHIKSEINPEFYMHINSNKKTNVYKLCLLFDVEVVKLCYSPDRNEKHRIIFVLDNELPSYLAIKTSETIIKNETNHTDLSFDNRLTNHPIQSFKYEYKNNIYNYNQGEFFVQRPPGELITSNLVKYFPEIHQKELEATIRSSVRYSNSISMKLKDDINIHNDGANNDQLTMNENKESLHHYNSIKNYSGFVERIKAKKTIGDHIIKNVAALDEAVNFLKDGDKLTNNIPPKITSIDENHDNLASKDQSSLKSGLTLKAGFVDGSNSNDNRYVRIETLFLEKEADTPQIDNTQFNSNIGVQNWLKGAKVGSGNFGTVYLGMNSLTGEIMAVKQIVQKKSKLFQNFLLKKQKEIYFLKELNHENIIRYHGSSLDDHHLNIFLEYIPGGSIYSMLLSYGPFEEPLIRNFVRQVLIGLNYLHSKNIVHMDIKGANVLIDIKGKVKIGDFGISQKLSVSSKLLSSPKKKATLQGSIYWMAPEVIKYSTYTIKADIWLVGCLIIEMFTGCHPFPDLNHMQAIFKLGNFVSPQIPACCTLEAKYFLQMVLEFDYNKRLSTKELLKSPFLNPLIMSKF